LRRELLILAAGSAIFFVIAFGVGLTVFVSPLATHYVESDGFRRGMEEETAKGLHFPRAHYAPIRRTGSLTAQSESFEADNGQKVMKSLDAHGITAEFNPWGVFLRQWRFTSVRVESGDVEIQIYKANQGLKQFRPSRGPQFSYRTEFTWRRLNRSRPTSLGDFAASAPAFSAHNY
jgi:hypothetical protein